MKTRVTVDTHLRFDPSTLDASTREMIRDALTFPNPHKAQALRERMWNAESMPDTFTLYEEGKLPRGFMGTLRAGLESLGYEIEWVDRRVDEPIDTSSWKMINLRAYQHAAVHDMYLKQQGMWQAPPGAGKTVGILELVRCAGSRALVITNKSNIARQWVQRSQSFLGYTPGVVGDGEFEVKDLTIALIQTLWSRQEDLDITEWWENFGVVVFDECHHLPANTWDTIAQKFPARYRLGVSGTPEWTPGSLEPMEAVMGPILHTTTDTELQTANVLVRAEVYVHKTGFDHPYFSTHDHPPGTQCAVAGCKGKRGSRVHRNNYTEMVGEIVHDNDRNRLIGAKILDGLGESRTQIVLSARLAHLDTLKQLVETALLSMGYPQDQIDDALYTFTGKESSEERMRIVERAEHGGCVIFSTIGDEALDIPHLDTVHLAWPTANVKKVEQQIGRILRVHPRKLYPKVHDYADYRVSVLRKQFWGRHDFYTSKGWSVSGLASSP